eukprot:TRINITY_DN21135_c0_g1_i1.p1 TRINITY_DN21135_c0_g1~~TRINITY_DN21135_c0_g1_i1.p1  ORF type:complete len:1146 (+),score=172.52 TRINITY_DN21135_c0_g1_i1:39-3476(+)
MALEFIRAELCRNRLEDAFPILQSLGVECTEDLQDVRVSDLSQLTVIQQRRFCRWQEGLLMSSSFRSLQAPSVECDETPSAAPEIPVAPEIKQDTGMETKSQGSLRLASGSLVDAVLACAGSENPKTSLSSAAFPRAITSGASLSNQQQENLAEEASSASTDPLKQPGIAAKSFKHSLTIAEPSCLSEGHSKLKRPHPLTTSCMESIAADSETPQLMLLSADSDTPGSAPPRKRVRLRSKSSPPFSSGSEPSSRSGETHYSTLGIPIQASTEEVRKAYKLKALQSHPDKGGSKEEFQRIVNAYEILVDPGSRRAYDMEVGHASGSSNQGRGCSWSSKPEADHTVLYWALREVAPRKRKLHLKRASSACLSRLAEDLKRKSVFEADFKGRKRGTGVKGVHSCGNNQYCVELKRHGISMRSPVHQGLEAALDFHAELLFLLGLASKDIEEGFSLEESLTKLNASILLSFQIDYHFGGIRVVSVWTRNLHSLLQLRAGLQAAATTKVTKSKSHRTQEMQRLKNSFGKQVASCRQTTIDHGQLLGEVQGELAKRGGKMASRKGSDIRLPDVQISPALQAELSSLDTYMKEKFKLCETTRKSAHKLVLELLGMYHTENVYLDVTTLTTVFQCDGTGQPSLLLTLTQRWEDSRLQTKSIGKRLRLLAYAAEYVLRDSGDHARAAVVQCLKDKSNACARRGLRRVRQLCLDAPQREYALKAGEANPVLYEELSAYHRYLTQDTFQQLRPPVRSTSAAKILDKIALALGWLVHVCKHDASSLLLRDLLPSSSAEGASVVFDFSAWLQRERKAMAVTRKNHLEAFLNLAFYLFAEQVPNTDKQKHLSQLGIVQELRRQWVQVSKQAKAQGPAARMEDKWVDWPQFLDVVQKMRTECRVHRSTRGKKKAPHQLAKQLQSFLILAIFARIPDRQRTLRELEIGRTLIRKNADGNRIAGHEAAGERPSTLKQIDYPPRAETSSQNAGWFISHGPLDYKTGGAYGARPLLPLGDLGPDIDDFINHWRPHLRPSGHNYLFCKPKSGAPVDGSFIYKNVRLSVARFTGKLANPHLLRDMVVTHVRNTDVSYRQLEGLAACMGHSMKQQATNYDKRSKATKLQPGIDLLQSMLLQTERKRRLTGKSSPASLNNSDKIARRV